jgi:hypothetical protein
MVSGKTNEWNGFVSVVARDVTDQLGELQKQEKLHARSPGRLRRDRREASIRSTTETFGEVTTTISVARISTGSLELTWR